MVSRILVINPVSMNLVLYQMIGSSIIDASLYSIFYLASSTTFNVLIEIFRELLEPQIPSWFNCILLVESISSNTEGGQSYLDHTITFEDIMPYLIYDILEILWLEIYKLQSKHDNPFIRCLWCLNSIDHIHNCYMNQPDRQLGVISFYEFI